MAGRDEQGFAWGVGCGMDVFAKLAGVRFDLIFHDLDAIVEAYRTGLPRARELFGPHLAMGPPGWQGVSYGHANALGAPLRFPEDSEVAVEHVHDSLEGGIRDLKEKQDLDFSGEGLFPFYLDLWEGLKRAFPDLHLPFRGFVAEGPMTTGWILRGHDFFVDILEQPERTADYMRLVTDSIIRYNKLMRRVNGGPEFSPKGAGMCDDISAMISPRAWPETVMPFHEQYYAGQTSGRRTAHIEGLSVDHLRYLDELGLERFDPSVSPRLTPALIRDNCSVPFQWRLNAMQMQAFSKEDVGSFVRRAAAEQAAAVICILEPVTATPEMVPKVYAFLEAGKDVERRLAEGCPREALLTA